jgi:hypothetical protein
MTISKKLVIRILLMVARMVAEEEQLKKEIEALAGHIAYLKFGEAA